MDVDSIRTESKSAPAATGLPGDRLPMLRHLIETLGRPLRILETHSGLTGMIAENVRVKRDDGTVVGFDGMWSSSLTASCLKGKPDIEVVDTTARCQIVADTLSVTTLPLIYDADTGGKPEIFKFTVRTLEEMGVSACIIEDKTGLKQNSLFGTERTQVLADIPSFCELIQTGRDARRSDDFMVIARIEALIAGYGMEEALKRAAAYSAAGADAIMIHSREKSPAEVLSFCKLYRDALAEKAKPIVVVPSSYNVVYESELAAAKVAIIIYANHLMRASYPASKHAHAQNAHNCTDMCSAFMNHVLTRPMHMVHCAHASTLVCQRCLRKRPAEREPCDTYCLGLTSWGAVPVLLQCCRWLRASSSMDAQRRSTQPCCL